MGWSCLQVATGGNNTCLVFLLLVYYNAHGAVVDGLCALIFISVYIYMNISLVISHFAGAQGKEDGDQEAHIHQEEAGREGQEGQARASRRRQARSHQTPQEQQVKAF